MFFPYTVGKSPSFSIRAAHPARAKVFDTKFMITSGKTGTHGVGINTSKPKSGLDVRGHLHIQSDPQGDASIYFPRSGERPGLYLRSADEADKSDSDKSTRFYLSEAGMVGVNTLEPASGIDIQAHEGTEFGGDILIKQGNLRVHSGIYDLNKKYMLQLNQNNVFHALSTEDSLSVGKVRTNGKGEHQLHLAGTEAPTLRVDNTGEGPAGFALQSGAVVWTTLQDSENGLHIAETQGSKRPRLFLDKAGHLMVGGDKKVQPKYGLQLDTKAAHGAPENSLAVTKGGLHIHGGLFKKTTDQDGEQTTWQLNPGGYSNLNELKITNRLSIGRTQQGQDLSIQKHHSVSLGDAGFLYSSGTSGTISFNEYSVLIGGKKEYKLHNKEDHGASMHLSNDGTVTMAATVAPGDLKMNTLFVVDAVRNNVQFGKYAKFGSSQGDESSIKIPLQVQGDPETGQVAFGTSADAYGRLGSNNNNVMLSTTDGKKSIAVEHSSGMVGVGTQNVTEDLTLVSNHPAASIFLSSRRDPRKTSSMTLQSGGDIKLSASASSSNSGKLVLKEFSHIQFSDSKSQQGGTVFDRSGGTREAPAGTKFVSGKVGVGVNNPQRLLHVNGDTWWQGRLYITKGFAQDLLESESLIQVGESTVTQNDHASDTTDVVTMLEKLTHIVRQNKLRLRSQMETISQMEQQVSTLLG